MQYITVGLLLKSILILISRRRRTEREPSPARGTAPERFLSRVFSRAGGGGGEAIGPFPDTGAGEGRGQSEV